MTKQSNLLLSLEAVWWVFTLTILGAILYPIISNVDDYPFLIPNIIFIIAFITLTRHLFFLKHSLIARKQVIKVALIFISIPFIFFLIHQLNIFQTFIDEKSMDEFMTGANFTNKPWLIRFIKTEMIFFGVGSILTAILFPLRMMISIWRTKNRNTV